LYKVFFNILLIRKSFNKDFKIFLTLQTSIQQRFNTGKNVSYFPQVFTCMDVEQQNKSLPKSEGYFNNSNSSAPTAVFIIIFLLISAKTNILSLIHNF